MLLNNASTHIVTPPTIPLPAGAKVPSNPLSDISFESPGSISVKKISNTHTLLQMIRQVNAPASIDNIVTANLAGDTLSSEQLKVTEMVKLWTITPIRETIAKVFTVVLTILILIAIIWIVIVWRTSICRLCLKLGKQNPPRHTALVNMTELEPMNPDKERKIKKVTYPNAPPESPYYKQQNPIHFEQLRQDRENYSKVLHEVRHSPHPYIRSGGFIWEGVPRPN